MDRREFLSLRRYWYAKLKESGFDDLEVLAADGNFYDLLRYPLRINPQDEERKNIEEHYALAREYACYGRFKSKLHRAIWDLYAEGASLRTILDQLKPRHQSLKISQVHQIVLEYRRQLRLYVLKEAAKRVSLGPTGQFDHNGHSTDKSE